MRACWSTSIYVQRRELSDARSMVVVETGGRPVIVGGDVAVRFGEFDEPPTEVRQRGARARPRAYIGRLPITVA